MNDDKQYDELDRDDFIAFRGQRYTTALGFKGRPHRYLGLELVITDTPRRMAKVVGVDVMRSVVLLQHEPYDADEPIYGLTTFDGVELLKKDSPAAVTQEWVEMHRDESGVVPGTLFCSGCGWVGEMREAQIKPFASGGDLTPLIKGNDYHCPNCQALLLHDVELMS